MVYTYTPTYYTSLHDSITSICKNILPFSFKKRRIPAIAAAEQRLSKQQSDNLKWQQESFHQVLNLIGLCKEGIIQEDEVSAFRTHLLETIITAPIDHEPASILRDKLIFLQELLYANCISEDEYHASKRPLLQRLAVQGAVIGAKDVIVARHNETSNAEWSIIDLKDERCSTKNIKPRDRNISTVVCSTENPFWNDNLNESKVEKQEKGKKKYKVLFNQKDGNGDRSNEHDPTRDDKETGKKKASWGFDRFMKWKKNESDDETAPLSLTEKSDEPNYRDGRIVAAEGQDIEQRNKNLCPNRTPSSDDKAVGRNMKEELTRIQTELRAKNPRVRDDRIEEISTHLPVDNNDLRKFFPKSWCDRHGDAMLEVVRREYKDHIGQIGNIRASTSLEEKNNSKRWTTFDDEENAHPNVLATHDEQRSSYSTKQGRFSLSKNTRTSFNSSSSSIDKGFKYNPFFDM